MEIWATPPAGDLRPSLLQRHPDPRRHRHGGPRPELSPTQWTLIVDSGTLTIGSGITVERQQRSIGGNYDTRGQPGDHLGRRQRPIAVDHGQPHDLHQPGHPRGRERRGAECQRPDGQPGQSHAQRQRLQPEPQRHQLHGQPGPHAGAGQTLTLGGTWSNAAGSAITATGATLNLGN